MPDSPQTSTLLATERRLSPLVRATMVCCSLATAVLLAAALPWLPRPLWLALAAAGMAPLASNGLYLCRHAQPTVGMIPVSLVALLPASLAPALARGLPQALRECCGLLCATTTLGAAFFCLWFIRLRRAYHSRPSLTPDAALIVLGGAVRKGRPCRTLALRLDVAARLWREAPTRRIVLSGGPTPDGSTTEAATMARYLQQHGVDKTALIVEPHARNTRENIARSCALLDAAGVGGQRCVVSSNYHLWRACRDGRALGIDLVAIAAPTPIASAAQQWSREVLTILAGR